MGKVYVFLAQGFEEIEALTVVDLARRAGLNVETVSIYDDKLVVGARKVPVVADITLVEVDESVADMLVLPGGAPGWKNLEACDALMSMVERFIRAGRRVSAICAAPSILGRKGFLVGKRACVYPGMDGDLRGADVTHDSVAVDGNIITSRGMGTAIDWSLAIIETLINKETAAKIAESVVYCSGQ